jgi:hypothetical protein
VTWSVDNVVGGNATVGTITPAWVYTLPSAAGTHKVTATTSGGSGNATVYVTNDAGQYMFNIDVGSLYFATGNGTFDANTGGKDYGDSYERISPSGTIQDYFTPSDQATLSSQDLDLDSGGVMIPPDQGGPFPHEIINAGKDGTVYVVNRDNMGHFNSSKDQVIQELVHIFPNNQPDPTTGGNFSAPVYFNGSVHFAPVQGPVQAFSLSNGLLSTSPTSKTTLVYGGRGGTTAISAYGSSSGILWALQPGGRGNGTLHAYAAGADRKTVSPSSSGRGSLPWVGRTPGFGADGGGRLVEQLRSAYLDRTARTCHPTVLVRLGPRVGEVPQLNGRPLGRDAVRRELEGHALAATVGCPSRFHSRQAGSRLSSPSGGATRQSDNADLYPGRPCFKGRTPAQTNPA